MSAPDQASVVLFTLQALKEEGSWCGETHVQKTLYMCQEIVGAPSKFKFILYKHGPYSFELSECLQGLIADDLILMQTRPPYGPSLAMSDEAHSLAADIDQDGKLSASIRFMSKKLGRKGVAELEKLATATYVNRKFGSKFLHRGARANFDLPQDARSRRGSPAGVHGSGDHRGGSGAPGRCVIPKL